MYLLEKDVYLLTPFLVLSLRVYSRSKQWQRIILPSKWNTKIGNVCISLILLVATAVEKMFELLFYLKKECTEFQIKPDPGAGVKLKENCFFLLSRFHNLFSSIVLCLWTFYFFILWQGHSPIERLSYFLGIVSFFLTLISYEYYWWI